jgi:hypothetical protein
MCTGGDSHPYTCAYVPTVVVGGRGGAPFKKDNVESERSQHGDRTKRNVCVGNWAGRTRALITYLAWLLQYVLVQYGEFSFFRHHHQIRTPLEAERFSIAS